MLIMCPKEVALFSSFSLDKRQQKKIFLIVAAILGAAKGWHLLHSTYTDMISYLDMGDAFFRGDWATAINAYWSPLYPVLLGLAMKVFRPSPYWELPTVQIVNFLVFMGASAAFAFFLDQVLLSHNQQLQADSEGDSFSLPDWALSGMGYALFFWASFKLISTTIPTPDMCVSAFVYLAAGVILAIRREEKGSHWYVGLGGILGLAYLTKAVMFPVSIAFLFVAFILTARRLNFSRIFLSILIFAVLACPLVTFLSLEKGRFTFGDTGKLGYIWHVNKVEHWVHWQGGLDEAGTPVHPTRKILDKPAIYEFEEPVGGTYPPFHDPSYWYEGAKVKFDLRKLASSIVGNMARYYDVVLRPQGGVIALMLMLFLVGERKRWSMKMVYRQWPLLLPAALALGLYLLVDVLGRYVGAFVTLLGIGILVGLRMGDTPFQRKTVKTVSILMVVFTIIPAMLSLFGPVKDAGSEDFSKSGTTPKPWVISEGLFELGLGPGDKVATLGSAWKPYWARLARLRIVAELPKTAYMDYWAADNTLKQKALAILFSTGAKAVVCTEEMPATADASGWQKIGQTNWHVMVAN